MRSEVLEWFGCREWMTVAESCQLFMNIGYERVQLPNEEEYVQQCKKIH